MCALTITQPTIKAIKLSGSKVIIASGMVIAIIIVPMKKAIYKAFGVSSISESLYYENQCNLVVCLAKQALEK
jgi:hypothetical protein